MLGVGNFFEWQAGADPEKVGAGVRPPPPLEKSETIYGFLAILVRIPWKKHKATSQHLMLGHHWQASETSENGPIIVIFGSALPSSKKSRKTLSKFGPLWQNFLDPRTERM